MGLLSRLALVVALLLPTFAMAAPCRVAITKPKVTLDNVSDALLLAAIVPSVDDHGVARLDSGNAIADCRGQRTTSFWPDESPRRKPGSMLIGGRQKLPGPRLAVWVVTDRVRAKPVTYRNGFLAIVRLAGNELIADAVGVWGKGDDAELALTEGPFGPHSWLEPFGHSLTSGLSDVVYHNLWVADDAGTLTSAGAFVVEAHDEDTHASGPHWRMELTATIVPGNKVKVIDQITWTLIGGDKPEVQHTTVTHLYALNGGKLVEVEPSPRTPPRALPQAIRATAQTLRLPVVAGELELVFDPRKISEAELTAAVDLSPWGLPDGHAPYSIERCLPQDNRYVDCGSRDIDAPGYLTNGEINMQRNQAALEQARATKVVPAMQPALDWKIRSMTFYIALEEHRLAFLRTHDPTILRRPIEGIDPMKSCAAVVKKVIELPYGKEQSQALRVDWQNCMNAATGDRFTAVPKEPWQNLLKTTGTTETLRRTNAD